MTKGREGCIKYGLVSLFVHYFRFLWKMMRGMKEFVKIFEESQKGTSCRIKRERERKYHTAGPREIIVVWPRGRDKVRGERE